MLATTLLFLLGLGCAGPGTVHKRTWVEVSTPNFTIWSCQSERATLELARDLELFRSVVEFVVGRPLSTSQVPIRVYAFDTATSYRAFAPRDSAGLFFQTMRQNIIVLSPARKNATRVIQHEYVHFLLANHEDFVYPPWYHEGFAEFLGTAALEDQDVEIGAPPGGLWGFRMATWVPLEELLATKDRTNVSVATLYGQSWAFVHYLNFGRDGKGNATRELTTFFRARERGRSVEDAVESAFGMSVDQLDADLQKYVKKRRFSSLVAGIEHFDLGASPTLRTLSRGEIATALGELSLLRGRPELGFQYFQDALAVEPASSRARLGLANAHVLARRWTDAEAEYGALLEAIPDDAVAHLDYANFLHWQAREVTDEAERAQLARRARSHYVKSWKLDDSIPETYAGYGATFLLEGQPTEKGLKTLRHAHQMLPSSVDICIDLALAYHTLGRSEDARRLLIATVGYIHDEARRKEVEAVLVKTGGVPGGEASGT